MIKVKTLTYIISFLQLDFELKYRRYSRAALSNASLLEHSERSVKKVFRATFLLELSESTKEGNTNRSNWRFNEKYYH